MLQVPNAASYAAIHVLEEIIGKRYGGSTGTNFYGACLLMADMARQQQSGSVVILGCDAGELYRDTYYNPQWLDDQHISLDAHLTQLRRFVAEGVWHSDNEGSLM